MAACTLKITKNELNSIPYLYNRKKWTGWDLNPRPQQCQQEVDHCTYDKVGRSFKSHLSTSATYWHKQDKKGLLQPSLASIRD